MDGKKVQLFVPGCDGPAGEALRGDHQRHEPGAPGCDPEAGRDVRVRSIQHRGRHPVQRPGVESHV